MNENDYLNQTFTDYTGNAVIYRNDELNQRAYYDEQYLEMCQVNEYGEPPHQEPIGEICDECNGNIYYDRLNKVFWCACPR